MRGVESQKGSAVTLGFVFSLVVINEMFGAVAAISAGAIFRAKEYCGSQSRDPLVALISNERLWRKERIKEQMSFHSA